MNEKTALFECSQCGATDFDPEGAKRVRCAFCGSLYEILSDEPKLVILPGANVVFGKDARVEIHGDVEIQKGARVDIQGKIVVVKGKQRTVFGLKLIKPGADDHPRKEKPAP